MVSDHKPDTSGESTVPQTKRNPWRYVFYLSPFLLIPILILLVAVLVIPTDWFADRSNNLFMDTLGYRAALHNADCKVAIYDDSPAILGVTGYWRGSHYLHLPTPGGILL